MPSRRELANAIRALSMDAIQKANSGHPGAPMGMADIAQVLWGDYLSHNPSNPKWTNRDRFVLSNGHGSMLLYSLLHLSGYDLGIEDIKNFRQLHSKTAGHPEYGYAPGVETTTGPLGQGVANAVGMAIAEKTLAAQFNRPNHEVIDHFTYVFLGDGCLMEGVSHEVCSLAGTLKLGKLICFYDDNGISIDGEVEGWFTDDTPKRFESYGWQVIPSVDGHNSEEIRAAIEQARANPDQPTMICCKTIIGYGSPNMAGTHDVHGKALGDDEIAATKKAIGWEGGDFEVADDIYQDWNAKDRGQAAEAAWNDRFEQYAAAHPELAADLKRRLQGDLPEQWDAEMNQFIAESQAEAKKVATRKSSEMCLNKIGPLLPELLGGSADLAGSNNTIWKGSVGIQDQADGNYVHYGVREFGMTAIMNGVALYGGLIPYGATFLIFMEYARNAVRMSALMKQRVVHVYTHDSIGLGEDGPTHQPVEQLTSLRSTPNLATWRPADTVETAIAWKDAIESNDRPTALVLTRQGLPVLDRTDAQIAAAAKGAYVIKDVAQPQAIIIATGSEVQLAMAAAEQLGDKVRVVSMPSAEVFEAQDAAYKESVLPAAVTKRVAIEAGKSDFWYKYVGLEGAVIGVDSFGESAPAAELFKHFGITTENLIETVQGLL